MDQGNKVLEIVSSRGPLLPAVIAQELKIPILIASAMLSEQVSKGKLFVSSIKIGGSPLYFTEEERPKLQEYASRLPEKEFKAYNKILKEGVLRDKSEEPLMRVTLRQIKDFAWPVEKDVSGQKEVFWAWYLLSKDEVESKIKSLLGEIVKEKRSEPRPVVEKNSVPSQVFPGPEKVHVVRKLEKKPVQESLTKFPAPLTQPLTANQLKTEIPLKSSFITDLTSYLTSRNLKVIEQKVIKANHEVECILLIPSSIGDLYSFVKVLDKKKISDADIQSAAVSAQKKGLPLIFLYRGLLTKKAEKILTDEYRYVHAVSF